MIKKNKSKNIKKNYSVKDVVEIKDKKDQKSIIRELREKEYDKEKLMLERTTKNNSIFNISYFLSVLALMIAVCSSTKSLNELIKQAHNNWVYVDIRPLVYALAFLVFYGVIKNEIEKKKIKKLDGKIDIIDIKIKDLKNELYDKYEIIY